MVLIVKSERTLKLGGFALMLQLNVGAIVSALDIRTANVVGAYAAGIFFNRI